MDVKIVIDGKNGYDYQFKGTLDLREFDDIKNRFRKKTGKIPEISKPNWWYKKSDFGLFFLNEMRRRYKGNIEMIALEIVSDDEWREFFPVFKRFFPTMGEYSAVKNNVAFWNSFSSKVIEDAYFVKWVILRQYGYLDYESMCNMPFKEMMMMYYYGLLGKIFLNAERYADRGLVPPEEEQEEDMYR